MNRARLFAGIIAAVSTVRLFAGGSGLNVAVVVNTNSADSLQLGNYYCEKRQVPPQNVLRIGWTGGNVGWSLTDYQNVLLNPFLAMLTERGLTNQIEYVVLSMGIPYRVSNGNGDDSTTSALFYGFKPYECTTNCVENFPSCDLPAGGSNSYAFSEGIFRQTPPINAASNSFLVTMITSSNLALARQIVDSGVLSDSTFPTQTVRLLKTSDPARNIRYQLFDDAIFNTRLRGDYSVQRDNLNGAANLGIILGLETGNANFSVNGTTFVPGAMADNLTSFSGRIFENTGQTPILTFLAAGAAGSCGTVIEPCAYLEKFPSPQNHFYQSRGFSLAECYYQSLENPFQELIAGEPLAAPFAKPGDGDWIGLPPTAVLSGTTNLSLQLSAADDARPLQRVDLFLDGQFFQTLTNIAPAQGDVLYATINGVSTDYTVPADATIASAASGLAGKLNNVGYQNMTKVKPYLYGDRIELRSTDLSRSGSNTSISISNSAAATAFVRASLTNFLDSAAFGIRSYVIGVGVVTNDVLSFTATKTNGAIFSVSITNYAEGVTLQAFIQQLMNGINGITGLQGSDGLVAEDLVVLSSQPPEFVQFNLRARSPGINAAQIQVAITGSFDIDPAGTVKLDENLADLQPRNHLYITAGATNLNMVFPLDTTAIADGWHELEAVAYEGSHVRTQKRISQTVFVQNSSLSAAFNCLVCDTNFALEGTMQFSVAANTNIIDRIELFSTGGSWGVVSNQSSAVFAVAATNLQAGLHPFYALVTRDDGKQFRTETKWIRIVSAESPFALSVIDFTPTLVWPATAGRVYEVLSTTNLSESFQSRGSLTASNAAVQWQETNTAAPQQFYKVRTQP